MHDLTLKDIANAANISEREALRVFKKASIHPRLFTWENTEFKQHAACCAIPQTI